MAYTVFTPNALPNTLRAIRSRIRFITKNEILTGILNAYSRIADTPDTPPPTILLGITKIIHPKA
jgi:hypothetical protein